jgi:hypothetical protein
MKTGYYLFSRNPRSEVVAMKIASLSLFLILMGKIAYAEPVYLDCIEQKDSETKRFSVKLDEDTNKITHTHENGFAFNTDGFFTANEISYQQIVVSSGLKIISKYTINRMDLSFHTQMSSGSVEFPAQIPMTVIGVHSGTCSIVAVNKKNKI